MMKKLELNFSKKYIAIFGLLLIVLLVIVFLIRNTYGYYQENLELKDSLEMTVATLSYGLNEEYKVVVPAKGEVRVPIAVMGLNSEETKYQMYYRSSDDLTNVIVGYASYSSNLPSGSLAVGESKQVSLILQNNGDSEVTAFVGIKGGYQNNSVEDILLGNGEIRITNRIESEEVPEDMATPEDILSGKKAWVDGKKITGTMPNQGELNWKPSDGTTYTVPAGYYSGGTLDSQDVYNNGYEAGKADTIANFTLENFSSGQTTLLMDVEEKGKYLLIFSAGGLNKTTLNVASTTGTVELVDTQSVYVNGYRWAVATSIYQLDIPEGGTELTLSSSDREASPITAVLYKIGG